MLFACSGPPADAGNFAPGRNGDGERFGGERGPTGRGGVSFFLFLHNDWGGVVGCAGGGGAGGGWGGGPVGGGVGGGGWGGGGRRGEMSFHF